ncbi:MAG TPA: rhodanese-related sulfurtransferase [Candidatus Saccharimonadales bacterium]|nr:rhodanese-related sulfurtransferase [Candidatus Saccharimonadales bacterium]
MQKIILYYKFAPVKDPEAVRLWQRTLCEKLGLKGRVLISEHGINGTLGGDIRDLKAYAKATKSFAPFKGMVFKWSDGQANDFPKLVVKVRPEIVTFGASDEIAVNEKGVIGGGKHLKPRQVHQLVEERGDDVIFFDGRNKHEAAVGRFRDAVVPDVEHTRDFIDELADPKYNDIKDKPIVTYCTGGIRCEVLSMLMKKRGFKEVYQIDGGIVKYGEEYGDGGLWEGSLYVFDDRLTTKFSDHAADIGSCVHCNSKTSGFMNCANKQCNRHVMACDDCQVKQYCPDCLRKVNPEVAKIS